MLEICYGNERFSGFFGLFWSKSVIIGHFDNEIDTAFMRDNWKFEEVKPQVHKVYRAADHNKSDFVLLLSEGRLVNLGNAKCTYGTPSSQTYAQQIRPPTYG